MWGRAKGATKRRKQKRRVGNLLADERCSPAVLDFLRSTYVGRAAPPVEDDNWDSEEEVVVAAAEVMDEVEEPVSSGPRALGMSYFPLSGYDFFGHFLGALHFICHGFLWGRRGGFGTADRKRIK